jgi:hypothetical protein
MGGQARAPGGDVWIGGDGARVVGVKPRSDTAASSAL